MSEASAENAAILPATEDGEKNPIELPKSIKLSKSQRVSLNALALDEQRFNQRMNQLQQEMNQGLIALQEAKEARAEIHEEIEAANNLEAGTLGNHYVDNGKEFVKATK